jgi:hypothetical protein
MAGVVLVPAIAGRDAFAARAGNLLAVLLAVLAGYYACISVLEAGWIERRLSRILARAGAMLLVASSAIVLLGGVVFFFDSNDSGQDFLSKDSGQAANSYSVDEVDRILLSLEWGNLVFKIPRKLHLEKPTIVQVHLSTALRQDQLQALLERMGPSLVSAALPEEGHVEADVIRVSNRMDATLVGTAFEITPQSPGLQAMTSLQPSLWEWKVTPKQPGLQHLRLTIAAHVDVAGKESPLVLKTFEQTVDVEVTYMERVVGCARSNSGLLGGSGAVVSIVVALGSWIIWKRRERRKRIIGFHA